MGAGTSSVDSSLTLQSLYFQNTSALTLDALGGSTLGFSGGTNGIFFASNFNVALNVPLSGTGTVLWLNGGTGTLTLNPGTGSNTFTGSTEVYAGGTLADGENNSFSANSELYVGGGSVGTVQVNFNETVLALGSGGTNGTINIASGKTLTLNSGLTDTFPGVIQGAGNLQKLGSSTQILTGANTYTGTTTVGSGADIQIGDGLTAGSLASSGVSGSGGLSFAVPNTYTTTYSGPISGSLGVATNNGSGPGTGTTILSGNNTYTGATTVNAGTLKAGSSTAFGNSTQTLVVNGGFLDLNGYNVSIASVQDNAGGAIDLSLAATLTLTNTSASTTIAGAVTGSGVLSTNQYQLIVTSNYDTYAGGTIIGGGTLVADNSNSSTWATGTGGISILSGGALLIGQNDANGYIYPASFITNDGVLQFFRSDNFVFANNMSGTGAVDKFGNGTVQFTAINTYTGTTTLSSGTMQAGANNVFSAGSRYTFNGSATLDLNNYNEAIGSFDGSASGMIALGTGTLTVTNGLGVQFNGTISGSGIMAYAGGSSIVTGTNSYSGGTSISNGSLLVAGAGSGTGSGPITITPTGTLYIGAASNLGSVGAGTITDNGTLEFNRSDMPNFTTAITGTGSVQTNGGGAYLTANNSYSGGTTINTGDISVGNGSTMGARITGNVYVASGAGLEFMPTAGDNYTFNGAITGPGSVTFAGPASIALSNISNTYSGTTYVNGGNLSDGGSNAFSQYSNMLVNSAGGSLTVHYAETVGNLENGGSGGPVAIAGGAILTSLGNAYAGDFMGNISGTGGFTVSGGVQGLGGNNTYSGGTLITNGGELFVSSDTAAGTGLMTFDSGTELSPNVDVTLSNNILLLNGEALDNDDGANNNLTLTGLISESGGSGGITWCTPGTLTLTGANTFTGTVDMREGTLVVGNNTAAGMGGTIILDTSTTLNVMTGVTTSNPINFTGGAATLTGSGTIATPINAGASVIIAPMASPGGGPGNLTFSNGLTLASGAAIHFDIYNATGAAGTGYSLISAPGSLTLTASPNTITFNIVSTDSAGNPLNAINFNAGNPYSWMFATSTSAITGFNSVSSQFNIVTSGFLNAPSGSFNITDSGNSLFLNFTPVPEPSTWALMGAGLLAILPVALRRRRMIKV